MWGVGREERSEIEFQKREVKKRAESAKVMVSQDGKHELKLIIGGRGSVARMEAK